MYMTAIGTVNEKFERYEIMPTDSTYFAHHEMMLYQ